MPDADRYVPPADTPAIDLGYGTESTVYGYDRSGSRCPSSKWVTPEGRVVWITTRQLQCLALALAHGADEAAYRLGLRPSTVKNTLTKVYKRLGVMNKWEAASTLGWVRFPAGLLDTPPVGAPPGVRAPVGGLVAGRGESLGRLPDTPETTE